MAGNDAVGDVLQQHGFTGTGRRNDQPALAETDGGHQVHDAGGIIVRLIFEIDFAFGIKRGEVVEQDFLAGHFRVFIVDGLDLEQGEVALRFLGLPYLSGNRIARSQVEPADLRRRHIDIVRPGQVVVARRSQKPESVRQDLQRTHAVNRPVFLDLGLQQGKNQFLLAHTGCPFDFELLRHLGQLTDFHFLQFTDIHKNHSA